MTKYLLCWCFFFLAHLLSWAQGAMDIEARDGGRFTLYINGTAQNPVPALHVRIDNLTEESYALRIEFENVAFHTISTHFENLRDAYGNFEVIVYKIVSKDGNLVLDKTKIDAANTYYLPEPQTYYAHFGQQKQAEVNTEPPQNQGNGSVSIISGGVNFGAPPEKKPVTAIPEKTIDHGVTHSPCTQMIAPDVLRDVKKSMAHASFENEKLADAVSMLQGGSCLTTDEVMEICRLFGFDKSKLDFAQQAYSHVSDWEKYKKVAAVFSSPASKRAFEAFLSEVTKE